MRMEDNYKDISNEIKLLINSLDTLFDMLNAHDAKMKLIDARWLAERAMMTDIGVGGSE